MDARPKERFGRVDVPNPGDDRLVQQYLLDAPLGPAQPAVQLLGRESRTQRLRSQLGDTVLPPSPRLHAELSKRAHVDIVQALAAGQQEGVIFRVLGDFLVDTATIEVTLIMTLLAERD